MHHTMHALDAPVNHASDCFLYELHMLISLDEIQKIILKHIP